MILLSQIDMVYELARARIRIKKQLASVRTRIERLSNTLLVSLHLRKNREMLSYVIYTMKEKSRKGVERRPSLTSRMWRTIVRVLFSKFETGLVLVIASMIILWLLPLYEWMSFSNPSLSTESFKSFFLVLWEVQASMLGITFVIIMFLVGNLIAKIESTYEKVSVRIVHEFLSASKIYVILPFCLCSIVYIGITILIQDTRQTYQNLTLFLSNIASILYLFYAAFNFFRPRSLEKLRLTHLKEEITESIDAEIERRISGNILMRLDKKLIKYAPFGITDKSSLTAVTISISKPKVISDINLSKILSYSENIPITLVRNIGYTISEDNNVLCYVPIGTDQYVIEAIRNCFVLKETDEEAVLLDALDGVREETREAVRIGKVSKLERVLDTYLSLLKTFLEQISTYGIHYDSKTARSELGFGWRQIFEIRRSFEQAVELAFKHGDLETIRWTAYFPRRVAILSVQYGDHYLFQRVISLFPFIYSLGSKAVDTRIVNFATDRSWRHLAETSLHIRTLLEKATDVKIIDDFKDYLVEILLTFNGLLKAALDNKDFEGFKKFGFALDDILKYFEPKPSFWKVEAALKNPQLTQEEKSELTRQLKVKEGLVEAKEKVEGTKKCIWLGLGAWITRLYRRQELTQDEFLAFLNETSTHFDNLEKLSSTFGLLTTFSDIEFGWNFWAMAEKREGVVFGVDTQEWMRWFYCIQGIRLTPTTIGEGTPISPSRMIVDRLESLKTACNTILNEPKKWESALGDKIQAKMSNFLLLNERAAEQQIRNEKLWLIDQELSTRICEDFMSKVVQAWKASASVGAVIELFGNSVDLEPNGKCKKIGYMGINVLEKKAAFVEGWHIGYSGVGEAYGRSLGNGENGLLLKEICSSLKLHKKLKRNKVCVSLYSAIMKLRKSQFNPNVIFMRDWDAFTYLQKSDSFKPRGIASSSEIDVVGCRGYFEDIPIFLLHECPINCCVVDIARLGILNRCKLNDGSQPYLKISITQINDELAKSMIDKNPKLLKDEKGKDRSLETATFELKQRVILKILEKVKFETQDKKAGLRLELAD